MEGRQTKAGQALFVLANRVKHFTVCVRTSAWKWSTLLSCTKDVVEGTAFSLYANLGTLGVLALRSGETAGTFSYILDIPLSYVVCFVSCYWVFCC